MALAFLAERETELVSGLKDKTGSNEACTLQCLLASAEQLRDSANKKNYEFIAYLADMTVMEIKREIERTGRSVEN